MEVTKENFDAILPSVIEQIKTAEFISFDEEMTGIMNYEYSKRNKKTDEPDDRYAKMLTVATRYSIIQFGMCLFQKVGSHYEASPYCFYLFPSSGPDITMSPGSIEFLKTNNLNFQKWIGSGIPFVNERGEEFLAKKYLKQYEADETKPERQPLALSRKSDIDYMDKNIAGLTAMIANPEETEFAFDYSNSFLRRAVYEYLDKNHKDLTVSKDSSNRIVVKKSTAQSTQEAVEANAVAKQIEDKKAFDAALGFRKVYNQLVESKKPIIGHNCMFDFLFMTNSLDSALPSDLTMYKELLSTRFPCVFDTKYMAASGALDTKYADTALQDLFNQMVDAAKGSASPRKRAANVHLGKLFGVEMAKDMKEYDSNGGQYHDAGYDAFITGLIFVNMLKSLDSMDTLKEKAANKCFMMQSLYHIDLDPTRPNGILKVEGTLVYLGSFPEATVPADLMKIFTDAGFDESKLDITWIDGSSCFVAVGDSNDSDAFFEKVSIPCGWQFSLYSQYIEAKRRPAESVPAPASGSESFVSKVIHEVEHVGGILNHELSTVVGGITKAAQDVANVMKADVKWITDHMPTLPLSPRKRQAEAMTENNEANGVADASSSPAADPVAPSPKRARSNSPRRSPANSPRRSPRKDRSMSPVPVSESQS
jgi:poly(A)-specific ribonuclease